MLEPKSSKITSHIKYPGWSYDHITSLFLRILFNPKPCDSSTKRGVNFTCVAGEATHPRGQSRYSLRPSVKMLRLNNAMKKQAAMTVQQWIVLKFFVGIKLLFKKLSYLLWPWSVWIFLDFTHSSSISVCWKPFHKSKICYLLRCCSTGFRLFLESAHWEKQWKFIWSSSIWPRVGFNGSSCITVNIYIYNACFHPNMFQNFRKYPHKL